MPIVYPPTLLYNGIINKKGHPVFPGVVDDMKGIKDEFLKNVLKKGWIDTRRYRYVVKDNGLYKDIIRIPKEYLGTMKVYEPWEPVCSYVNQITIYYK